MTSEPRVPPYGDRKQSADDVEPGSTERQGADVGGARRHRTSDAADVDDPGGRTSSPAEEQPAGSVDGAGEEDPGVGPAHTGGVTRGEEQRE
ncbi:MAG: hypothetical protein JWO98_907 [Frankiales bacterium]|jgi:hypothetical protein|nr:hypothetical protein [Frankiales bacterium]